MNAKGEISVGVTLMVAVTLIVGLSLYAAMLPSLGEAVNTIGQTNLTVTAPAANATVDLLGREVNNVIVRNSTLLFVLDTDYSISNNRIVNGEFGTAQLETESVSLANAGLVNVSFDYEDFGYIDDSGSRAVALLIPLMAALALLMASLWKLGVVDFLKG